MYFSDRDLSAKCRLLIAESITFTTTVAIWLEFRRPSIVPTWLHSQPFKASYLRLSPEKPRTSLCLEYGHPGAGLICVSLFVEPQAVPASIRALAIQRHVAKAKAAITPVCHRLSADPVGDPLDYNADRLNQCQGLHFLQPDIRRSSVSEGSLG